MSNNTQDVVLFKSYNKNKIPFPSYMYQPPRVLLNLYIGSCYYLIYEISQKHEYLQERERLCDWVIAYPPSLVV